MAEYIDLPPSIRRHESTLCDVFTGPRDDLIAAGLVKPEQLPPSGKVSISWLGDVQVKKRVGIDESYLNVHCFGDGSIRVSRGASREVQIARRQSKKEQRQARRQAWEAEDRQQEVLELRKQADSARSKLADLPKTKDEYLRHVAKFLRRVVRLSIRGEDGPTDWHGFRMSTESVEAVLLATDAVVEAVMQAQVFFDAALQAKIIEGHHSIIKAADPQFYAQLDRLIAPNPSILEGEAS